MLTTGTVTSAQVARERLGERVIHQYVPLDLKAGGEPISRPLGRRIWRSSPNPKSGHMDHSSNSARAALPPVLVNGRLSGQWSFAGWEKSAPSWPRRCLKTSLTSVAQSEVDAVLPLSCPRSARPVLPFRGAILEGRFHPHQPPSTSRCWTRFWTRSATGPSGRPSRHMMARNRSLAGGCHQRLKAKHPPDFLSVVVPRHPDRAEEIASDLATQGLKGRAPFLRCGDRCSETDVFLGDTIGEMGLYLRLTEIAFRRTFPDLGRRTEPARAGHRWRRPCFCRPATVAEFPRLLPRSLLETGGAKLVRDGGDAWQVRSTICSATNPSAAP